MFRGKMKLSSIYAWIKRHYHYPMFGGKTKRAVFRDGIIICLFTYCIVLYVWRKDKADGIIICQIAWRNKAQLLSYICIKDKAGGVRRGFLRFVLAICRLGRVLWHAVKATICTSPTNIADKKQSSLTSTNEPSAWYVICMLDIRIKRIYVEYSHQQALWKGFSLPFARQTLLIRNKAL